MITNRSKRDDAAWWNNHGVVCLARGDTLQAQKLFHEALRCARKELNAPSNNFFSPPIGIEPTYFGDCIGLDQQQEEGPNTPGPLHLQAFPICRRNFSLEPMVDRTICSSIIAFNLALVYHRKGIEGHQSLVEKARNLYEKCYRLLADTGANKGSTGDLLVDLLCMAILNNLAHISFNVSDYLRSTEYSNELIRFALSVASSPSSRMIDTQVSIALDQQKRNFLLNAMILRMPSVASAA
jgi:tetratricopeptide (TPR) repeat protein